MFIPERTDPLCGKPIVESTVMIDDPTDAASTILLLGVILKLPSTNDAPPYPMKSDNL